MARKEVIADNPLVFEGEYIAGLSPNQEWGGMKITVGVQRRIQADGHNHFDSHFDLEYNQNLL